MHKNEGVRSMFICSAFRTDAILKFATGDVINKKSQLLGEPALPS